MPTFRSIQGSSYSPDGSYQIVVNAPAGVQNGDLLVALVGWLDSSANPSPGSPGGLGGGWTEIDRHFSASGNEAILYYKIAASEPASWIATQNSNDSEMKALVAAYTGIRLTTPRDAHSKNSNGGTTALLGVAITPTANGELVVWAGFYDWGAAQTVTKPASLTLRQHLSGGSNGCGMFLADYTQPVAAITTNAEHRGTITSANGSVVLMASFFGAGVGREGMLLGSL